MFSFEKKRRLLNKIDFDNVFNCAKKIETKHFIILYRPNNAGYSRIGFAFSKKKIAKAHMRNSMKRLVRESFRKIELPAVDIVFLAKRLVKMEPNALITAGLMHAWQNLKILF